jgi:hypothetical protein
MSRAAFKVWTKKDMQSSSMRQLGEYVAARELRAHLYRDAWNQKHAGAARKVLDERALSKTP